jgi:hypothetical protein
MATYETFRRKFPDIARELGSVNCGAPHPGRREFTRRQRCTTLQDRNAQLRRDSNRVGDRSVARAGLV